MRKDEEGNVASFFGICASHWLPAPFSSVVSGLSGVLYGFTATSIYQRLQP
jgi:uncharacterized protein involved in exopolysaccharide biosynthesis